MRYNDGIDESDRLLKSGLDRTERKSDECKSDEFNLYYQTH